MNLTALYKNRFQKTPSVVKAKVWESIAKYIIKKLGHPNKLLDPAAGYCEFINLAPAMEKWAIDLNIDFLNTHANKDITKKCGNILTIDLPENYFDAIFVSNFLEHLENIDQVSLFLQRMKICLKPCGQIAIMGPNFKYCYKEYFDFIDHKTILTHRSLEELLIVLDYQIVDIIPKFLPYSFKSRFPLQQYLIKIYLKLPIVCKIA